MPYLPVSAGIDRSRFTEFRLRSEGRRELSRGRTLILGRKIGRTKEGRKEDGIRKEEGGRKGEKKGKREKKGRKGGVRRRKGKAQVGRGGKKEEKEDGK